MSGDNSLDQSDDPTWIFDIPDDDHIAPPVETREQELPLGKLSWQNFERLCHRLARTDGDVERCRLYGTEGQDQGGIDIYVSRKSTPKYAVWQSKRRKTFSASQIETAVTEFLNGDWVDKSDRFVLCVQARLRSTDIDKKVEDCRTRLQALGIQFEPVDGEELSIRLKNMPEIVDDFFGREWALKFCGHDAAQILAERLRPVEIGRLRVSLRACYASHFASVDPGVLSRLPSSGAGRVSVQLADRYVLTDFWLSRELDPPNREAEAPVRRATHSSGAAPELAAGVVRRRRARGVHQWRYAAFGRSCLLLFGLLRLRRLLDGRRLLRRLADDSREHKEQNRDGQAAPEKNEFAFADPVRSLDASSRREPGRRFFFAAQDGWVARLRRRWRSHRLSGFHDRGRRPSASVRVVVIHAHSLCAPF